jgi:hypothetical protein
MIVLLYHGDSVGDIKVRKGGRGGVEAMGHPYGEVEGLFASLQAVEGEAFSLSGNGFAERQAINIKRLYQSASDAFFH